MKADSQRYIGNYIAFMENHLLKLPTSKKCISACQIKQNPIFIPAGNEPNPEGPSRHDRIIAHAEGITRKYRPFPPGRIVTPIPLHLTLSHPDKIHVSVKIHHLFH